MNIKAHINEEGFLSLDLNKVVVVCGLCGNHDHENATIELNFRDQKIYYLCGNCKKMNEIKFGKDKIPPLPSIRIGTQ